MINADTLGENIAFHRRRRGLSQTEFAKLLDRSESWVSQVERGARSIDRLTVLGKVAEVLDVPLSELLGDETPFPVRPNAHPEAAQLRRVLGTPYALRAFVRRAHDAKDKPAPVTDLRRRVEPLWNLAHAAKFSKLCRELAVLIPDLEEAAQQYDGDKWTEVQELLLTTYQVTAALLAKLGEADAVWVAGDRAMAAAEAIDDPLEAVASAFRLALAFVSAQRLDEAIHLADGAVDAIAPYCTDDDPRSWSICGALHLVLSVAHARVNDATQARKHLRDAAKCAKHVGEGHNDFDTEFGPSNVALHAVSVEVELGNAGEALRLAEDVDTEILSPERRSSFRLSLALANVQRRQASEAIRHLTQAEEETPEQIHRNPKARQIVLDLLRHQRGDVEGLTDLASRMDLANDLPVQKVLDSTS
jgi:transcriptional regulator with XRE-family HTH domain